MLGKDVSKFITGSEEPTFPTDTTLTYLPKAIQENTPLHVNLFAFHGVLGKRGGTWTKPMHLLLICGQPCFLIRRGDEEAVCLRGVLSSKKP